MCQVQVLSSEFKAKSIGRKFLSQKTGLESKSWTRVLHLWLLVPITAEIKPIKHVKIDIWLKSYKYTNNVDVNTCNKHKENAKGKNWCEDFWNRGKNVQLNFKINQVFLIKSIIERKAPFEHNYDREVTVNKFCKHFWKIRNGMCRIRKHIAIWKLLCRLLTIWRFLMHMKEAMIKTEGNFCKEFNWNHSTIHIRKPPHHRECFIQR